MLQKTTCMQLIKPSLQEQGLDMEVLPSLPVGIKP